MNRIIIIGNGFDLSLDLATSYSHFITNLFQQAKEELSSKTNFSNRLLHISHKHLCLGRSEKNEQFNLKDFIDLLLANDYNIEYPSTFFKSVIDKSFPNWVDCETEYFEGIKRLKGNIKPKSIKEYNEDFKKFKEELTKYLASIHPLHESGLIELANQYDEDLFAADEKYKDAETNPIEILHNHKMSNVVLNFNYTDSFKRLSTHFTKTSIDKYINIHGELNSIDNPIIFGFGDEHNSEYHKIEHLIETDECEFIKSFNYVQQSNYDDLIAYMESGPFIVESFGHSLGLSDRTLLSEIAEHHNLHRFQIRYYQINDKKDDFFDLSVALSRHFKSKNRFRKIILPKDKVKPMPQFYFR